MEHIVNKAIAVLSVDGENFEIDGLYEGTDRLHPSCYSVTREKDRFVFVKRFQEFPDYLQIRKLIGH